ncbi:MAG: hypothetical protein WKF63_08345, partial [Thermomicrobiales bacterium]
MTRTEAAAALAVRLGTVFVDAGIVPTAAGLAPALDDALRAFGYAEVDLATAAPADANGFIAMGRYHALRLCLDRIADRFDVGIAGGSYKLQQTVATIERRLAEARGEVIDLFGSLSPEWMVDGAGTVAASIFALDLDYLDDRNGGMYR